VNQKIAVIEQNPLTLFVALGAGRVLALLLQTQPDLVGDGLVLTRVRSGADDEIIGERSDPGEIQNRDVSGFFILSGADSGEPSWCFDFFDRLTGNLLRLLWRQKLAPAAIVL
jgi:hypothetical protein